MDNQLCEKLAQLVEELTTSGEPQLNREKIKEVKNICKSSEEYISRVYHLVLTQLNKEHAEIRFSAFQIIEELFSRSHLFRTLVISNFQDLLELTVEISDPLPPPKAVAKKLKTTAIKAVQQWHEKYGEAYKKLSLGYYFLMQNKKVDFQDVQARTMAERKREEEQQKRLENIYKEKSKKAKKEMEEMCPEIQTCLTELDSCLRLLMPDPFDFNIDVYSESALNTVNKSSSSPAPQPASNENIQAPSAGQHDEEEPCCSKDLLGAPLKQGDDESRHSEEVSSNEQQAAEGDEDSEPETDAGEEDFIRSHGLMSHKYSLDLEISTDLSVRECEDNTAIVENVKDFVRLLTTKFLPSVNSWIQVFTKAGKNNDLLKQAIDLKKTIQTAMKKHEELNIEYKKRERKVIKCGKAGDDDDEDDEFIDVPEKEGYEPDIPDHLREEYGLETLKSKPAVKDYQKASISPTTQPKRNEEELDPTCAAATWNLIKDEVYRKANSASEGTKPAPLEPNSKRAKREEEKGIAPVIPFGIDLYYWGKEQPTAGKILKFSSQHRFWKPNELDEENENKELASLLKTRYITFAGKFEPVKHKCRAPMPDGKLCERQDRFKCPFHGKIIPRDELGNPTNPEDIARLNKEKQKQQKTEPEWQDPELMREIEAATGVDLGSSKCTNKKVKGKKKKYPNLTDLKQHSNTSRSRLEKKVLNKASLKRVVEAMDRLDKRKHDKFSNQFNYALH